MKINGLGLIGMLGWWRKRLTQPTTVLVIPNCKSDKHVRTNVPIPLLNREPLMVVETPEGSPQANCPSTLLPEESFKKVPPVMVFVQEVVEDVAPTQNAPSPFDDVTVAVPGEVAPLLVATCGIAAATLV